MAETRYTHKWFSLAILSLGIGGGFAFLVAMSRTPFGYRYFPQGYMYHALAGHVVLAILLWLLSFTVILWSRYLKGVGWRYSYRISMAGVFLITLSVLIDKGMAVPNNYVPTIVNPLFFLGLALFFSGFSLNVFGYLKEALRHLRSPDILINTLSISVLIATVMVAAMLYSLTVHRGPAEPFLYYERLFWTAGHIQQILNGALLVSVWYAFLRILGVEEETWGFLRYLNLVLFLSAILLFVIQIFIDPVDKASRIMAEMTYTIGLGLPIFLHIANILKGLFAASRHPDHVHVILNLVQNPSRFEIPKQVRNDMQEQVQGDFTDYRGTKGIAYVALLFSMAIYIIGVAIAYSGFGNDLRVPAHYHGAVTSLTLALMGFSYYFVRGYRERVYGERIARLQPVIYGVGMLLFILGLFISGAFGAPRKTYGVAFTSDPVVLSALAVMGVGTVLAVVGGILFVFYITLSLLKGGDRYEL